MRRGWEVLKRASTANGLALAEAAESTASDAVVVGTERDGFTETLATMFFVQAFNHSTEHRTQILSMLTALGAGPEGLDGEISGWAWGEENGALKVRRSVNGPVTHRARGYERAVWVTAHRSSGGLGSYAVAMDRSGRRD
jgi:hypothetical protein